MLSLIICTYRRPEAVRTLRAALENQTAPPEEILVVDASDDDRTERLLAATPDVRYFRAPPEHRGLTRQRNYGIERARGDIIAFLDDDTVPEPDYFEEIRRCFERRPEAGGVGGYIVEAPWRAACAGRPGLGVFRFGEWERREDFRWRLRRLLGLADDLPPGWMPPGGHGRPVSFLPPDGNDRQVEFVTAGVSAFRKEIFEFERFSDFFAGYGLYEDLEFCIRASRRAPLVLCTRARAAHYHHPAGRPNPYRYGRMVVRNGWHVWRLRWPSPARSDRLRWWATSMLLAVCRLGDLRAGRCDALLEAAGRFSAALSILIRAASGRLLPPSAERLATCGNTKR